MRKARHLPNPKTIRFVTPSQSADPVTETACCATRKLQTPSSVREARAKHLIVAQTHPGLRQAMTTTTPVSALPTQLHITPTEFTEGIRAFQRTWIESELEEGGGSGWRDVRVVEDSYGPPYLRITRLLDFPDSDAAVAGPAGTCSGNVASEVAAVDEDEDDQEVLIRSPPHNFGNQTTVIYDIVYSPAYRVPILYITISHPPPNPDILSLLVPSSHKAQFQHAGGPLGALSLTDHPLTSLPAYFIHPCRTAEGMAAITTDESRGERMGAPGYFMRWLGLVGPSVGLAVPVGLAEALGKLQL
ncbi:hypothetical protein LTR17_000190 [Elasticomyces elasticus]|nr:hypothetical protein LTR17_000190 [Elasticomyces elasticus]